MLERGAGGGRSETTVPGAPYPAKPGRPPLRTFRAAKGGDHAEIAQTHPASGSQDPGVARAQDLKPSAAKRADHHHRTRTEIHALSLVRPGLGPDRTSALL